MAAPPPYKATAGRANRAGTSYLYLATDDHTAIAEVRPHPNQVISVGTFVNQEMIRLADFERVTITECSSSDDELDKFRLIHSIARAFAEPLPPEQRWRYALTQLLADTLRRMKYGGIRFGSSVAAGANITAFDPTLWKSAGKTRVVVVKELRYCFEALPVVSDSDRHKFDYLHEELPEKI